MSDIIRLAVYNSQSDPKQYRGFLLKEKTRVIDSSGQMQLILSNGKIDISATGYNEDSAFVRAFNQIDKYLQEKNHSEFSL